MNAPPREASRIRHDEGNVATKTWRIGSATGGLAPWKNSRVLNEPPMKPIAAAPRAGA